MYPHLHEAVAVAQRHGLVFERLVVDRHRPRGADLVLAAVAAADRAALVVLGLDMIAELAEDLGGKLGLAVLANQREHRDLHRREDRVQAQHRALLALDLVLVVGVDKEREHRAIDAGRGLDHVRHVAVAGRGVDVLELLAGELRVLGQIEVAPVGDPLELGPADREQVLDVAGRARVVRQLVGVVGPKPQVVGAQPERGPPAHPLRQPVLVPFAGVGRGTKNSISICSNSRVRKMKFPVVISLRKLLPIWAIPNGGFLRANCM